MNEHPESALAHYRAGRSAEATRPRQAIESFQRAIELSPLEPRFHASLGQTYKRLGDLDAATGCFLQALDIQESPFGFVELADLFRMKQRHRESENALRSALRLDPSIGIAHELLGIVLEETGRFPEAIEELTKASELLPAKASILYRIASAKRITEEDRPFVDRLLSLKQSGTFTDEQRRYLEYALGKAYDDLGEYEAAFKCYVDANELSSRVQFAGRPYPAKEFRATFEAIKRRFSRGFFEQHVEYAQSVSEKPLLIIGMPRSGTTLVEQVLSSHPQVAAGGELPFWLDPGAKAAMHKLMSTESSGSVVGDLAAQYIEILQQHSASELRVTDKMPNNYMVLGLVHLLMPNARIIHCRRNPRDNCLSIYTTLYTEAPKFAYSRENIVTAYGLYQDLMAHWEAVIPTDRLLTIDYEALVFDREGTTRKMIDFCGVPWDDACLHHEANPHPVNTPSLWQVRQPMYSSSVNRWKHYAPWLGAFGGVR